MAATPAAHPADTITPQQRAVLDRLAAGHVPAWLIVYPDGHGRSDRDAVQMNFVEHRAASGVEQFDIQFLGVEVSVIER